MNDLTNKRLDLEGRKTPGAGLNHIAGAVQGNVQRCQRCGVILVDNRGAQMPEGHRPHYFTEGGPVFKQASSVGAFKEEKAPLCEVNPAP